MAPRTELARRTSVKILSANRLRRSSHHWKSHRGAACFGIAATRLIIPLCGQFISFMSVRKFFPESLHFPQGESGKFRKSLAILSDSRKYRDP
jgi:hypothetical protein